MFKKMFAQRKGSNAFTLETLVKDFMPMENTEYFYDAIFNVQALQNLICTFNSEETLFDFSKRFHKCYNDLLASRKSKYGLQFLTQLSKVVSLPILKKLASNNMTFTSLVETYKNGGDRALIDMLTETVETKPRIIKNKRVI